MRVYRYFYNSVTTQTSAFSTLTINTIDSSRNNHQNELKLNKKEELHRTWNKHQKLKQNEKSKRSHRQDSIPILFSTFLLHKNQNTMKKHQRKRRLGKKEEKKGRGLSSPLV